jgi:hypothetical protein
MLRRLLRGPYDKLDAYGQRDAAAGNGAVGHYENHASDHDHGYGNGRRLYVFECRGGSDRIIWNGSIATKESGPDAYRQFPIRLRKGDAIKVVGAASVEVALFILDTPKNQ